MKAISIVSIVFLSALTASHSIAGEYRYDRCSTVDKLLEDANDLDRKPVSVCGFLKFESEDQNLFSNFEAAELGDEKHCLAIGYKERLLADLRKYNGQSVKLTGKFKSLFCAPNRVCPASCGMSGILIDQIKLLPTISQ